MKKRSIIIIFSLVVASVLLSFVVRFLCIKNSIPNPLVNTDPLLLL